MFFLMYTRHKTHNKGRQKHVETCLNTQEEIRCMADECHRTPTPCQTPQKEETPGASLDQEMQRLERN